MELQEIQNKIYTIRDKRVMVDRDLAELYGVETRVLNQAVKRNIERFPSDFMFQLSDDEFGYWKSQIVISNAQNMGLRKKPFAFTELGVAMLSSVLKSKTAIEVNMRIMRIFVKIRQTVENNTIIHSKLQADLNELKEYINEVFTDYNDINEDTRIQFELINQSLVELQDSKKINRKPMKRIGYISDEE